ncbi:transposase [Kitasatospora purpeofusca]|nr:transposase [Kitasatospora purpeofusca]MDY0816235.1 transposase [Kitasatospora purpeofusca]
MSAWRAERRGKGLDIGRPPEHDLRRIMDAVLYVDRTGIPWRYLPHDTLGLLLAVWVTAASVSDNVGGIHLLSTIGTAHPRVTKAWVDSGYRTKAIDHGPPLV